MRGLPLRIAALAALLAGAVSPALAGQLVPVPNVIIYPGDIIRDTMIDDRELPNDFPGQGATVLDRNVLVGKTARRTLLPGLPVASNAVGQPKIIQVGSMVRVVFSEGDLTISTYASALQSGGVGDVIPLRNTESGLTISGTISADGSVRINNG